MFKNFLIPVYIIILLGISEKCFAGISGPTSVTLNNTYSYSFTNGTYLGSPNWQPSGGTVMSQSQNGTTYSASIKWTTADTRQLIFANYSQTLATLNVDVCSAGQGASVTISGSTSICVGTNVTYTATPTNGGTPSYVWKVDNVTKQSGSSNSYSTTQLALNNVVLVTMTSSISCMSPLSASASKTISSATQPTAVTANISHDGKVCPGQQASFTVTVTNGGSNSTYTWYRGNNPANDNLISGNTNNYQPNNALLTGETVKCQVTSNSTCISGSATVWSNIITITVTTVPTIPSGMNASNVTTTSMMANWGTVSGILNYRLDVALNSTFTNFVTNFQNSYQAGTSCNLSGLSPGTTYYYRVRAENCAGASVSSNTITTTLIPPAPSMPGSSSVTTISFNAFWVSTTGASDYRLDVSTNSGFSSFVTGYYNLTVTGTSQTVSGLTPGTTYYFQVRAHNSWGTSTNSTFNSVLLCPSAPGSLSSSNMTTSVFTANWAAVTSATSYRLDVSDNSGFSSFITTYNNLQVSGTNQAVSGLTAGYTYYFRVRAVNTSGTSPNSATQPALMVPPAPGTPSASIKTTISFTASWASAQGAADYRFDVSTNSGFTSFVSVYNNLTVSGTSQNVSGLSPGINYYFRVRANNTSGTSVNSGTGIMITLPVAPALSDASSITSTTFNASWNAVTSATEYRLDVSTASNFPSFVGIYNNLQVTTTTLNVTGLVQNTSYYFRVRAVNASGASANSNTKSVQVIIQPPNAITATNISANNITANWSTNSEATGYAIDVSTSGSFSSFIFGYNNRPVIGNSVDIFGLSMNTTYYYRVRSVNVAGASANSNTISQLTVPDPPQAVLPTALNSSGFTANWVPVSGITTYKFDVASDAGFTVIVSGYNNISVTGSSKVVTGLATGKTYYYRLRSSNTAGYSIYSNIIIGVSLDQNYVATTEITKKGITTLSQVASAAVGERMITTGYFDGLGRSSQQVSRQSSPDQYDIVQPLQYDNFGREQFKYLPYATSESNGLYKPDPLGTGSYTGSAHQLFYANGTGDKVVDDSSPFGKTVFEPSPLNRVMEQGSPGSSWQPDGNDSYTSTDRTLKFAYETNVVSEVLKWTFSYSTTYLFGKVNAGSASSPVYYAAGQLFRNKTKDEEYHEAIEYKDKEGKVILKSVQAPSGQWAKIYYIYNDFGNLVCVIPPQAVSLLASDYYQSGATDATKDAFLKRWAFRYTYDARRRMALKQVPGAEPVYLVYDNRDRLIVTQDGNQRTDASGGITMKEWTYTKYDILDRPVITGIYTHSSVVDQATMQSYVNSQISSGNQFYEDYNGNSATYGYTNRMFPVSSAAPLTVTYFDTYNFISLWTGNYAYVNDGLSQTLYSVTYSQPTTNNDHVTGQVTGTQSRVLDGSSPGSYAWSRSVSYFDDKYRMIEVVANNYKGGTERISNLYDFPGRVLKTKTTHVVGSITKTINRRFDYDHAGRLLKTWHKVDTQPEILLSLNDYNELGQLVTKNLHSVDNGTTFKQIIDYRYNIRGWLARINHSDLSSDNANDPKDYFGMELAYNDIFSGINNTGIYNGNISAVKWSSNLGLGLSQFNQATERAYVFNYDPINRLTAAVLNEKIASWNDTTFYKEDSLSYDLNGNILTLARKGSEGKSMDALAYYYGSGTSRSNKLLKVTDSGDKTKGFIDGANSGNDYSYDAAGNMTHDLNKSIGSNLTDNSSRIFYNQMNLPDTVRKSTGQKMVNIYNAAGVKLRQLVYNSSGSEIKRIDYEGEFYYENDTLRFISDEEGRVIPQPNGSMVYEYFLKDHLGNIRVTFTTQVMSDSYTAGFETANSTIEQAEFNPSYDNATIINSALYNHSPGGSRSQRLTAASVNNVIGLSKSLKVVPGDTVNIEVYTKYYAPTNNNSNVAALVLDAFGAAFGLGPGSVGADAVAWQSLEDMNVAGLLIHTVGVDGSAPKAYLNYILFDNNFVPYDFGFDQVSTSAREDGSGVPHVKLSLSAIVRKSGYVYIYLSNENDKVVEVYFDDLAITHKHSPVLEETMYYPFGMIAEDYKEPEMTKQPYLYNGKELQNDLDLNWYDYGARMYDAAIGRYNIIDEFAGSFARYSPYIYAANNPILFTDPDGNYPINIVNADGVLTRSFIYLINMSLGISSNTLFDTRIRYERDVWYHPHKYLTGYVTGGGITIHQDIILTNDFDTKGGSIDQTMRDVNMWLGIVPHELAHRVQRDRSLLYLTPYVLQAIGAAVKNGSVDASIIHDDIPMEAEANQYQEKFDEFLAFFNYKDKKGNERNKITDLFSGGRKNDDYIIGKLNDYKTEYDKAKEEESKKKREGLISMMQNFKGMQVGTYTWNGSSWVHQ